MEVNNREWAIVIWLAIFVVVVLLIPASRRSVPGLLKIFFGHRIFVPFMLMVAYTAGVITVLMHLGVWDATLVTPTIVWFLTTAVVNFLRVPRAMKERGYFRKLAAEAVAAPVVVQFLVDMYPFSLVEEVFLQGGFVIFGLPAAVAALKPEHIPFRRVLNVLVGVLVIIVVVHSISEISSQWSNINFVAEAKKFLLPIGMTAAFLPFMYGLTLYAAYDSAAANMRATVPAGTSVGKALLALAIRTGFSVRKLSAVTPRTRMNMARATTLAEGKAFFDHGQAAEAARLQEVIDKKQRLLDNAGLHGVDESGQQLDQREFAEIRDSLSYLHLCHARHYRQTGRYREDLLDMLGPATFAKKGLPEGAVITMHVADDGQQWWAWRKTITGWVFGIGASEAPNDRWEYDGPKIPSGGPGTDPAWRHFMVPAEPHQHW
ncbi:hypothetical protein AB0O52_01390 [Arthrobacter sp. NPDC080073]|uniref:hypothetical protein n=1 Tax=Arthrobacter sp. NPDC080073 TaxID=3155919 RepID=UPI0034295B4E